MLTVAETPINGTSSDADIPAPRLYIASAAAEKKAATFWQHRFDKYRALEPTELASEVITITPELAEWLLTYRNSHNRPLMQARVQHFADIIERGEWLLTSQGISFSRDGRLNNGQHRLSGILRSGRGVPILCTFGEVEKAFLVIDQSRGRTAGDALHLDGWTNGNAMAAAARVIYTLEQENTAAPKMTTTQVVEFINSKHRDLALSVSPARQAYGKFKRASLGGLTATHYWIGLNTSMPASKLDEFWSAFVSGENLPPRSPILQIRDGIAAGTYAMGRHSSGRPVRLVAVIVLAWNAWLQRRTPRKIDWAPNQLFPEVE